MGKHTLGPTISNEFNTEEKEEESSPNRNGHEQAAADYDPSLFDETWKRTWNINRLTAMCQGPTTLFVYWEVSDQRKKLIGEHFQSDWASLPFYLQLYDVTHIEFNGYNAPTTRIRVPPSSDNWYLHQLAPRRRYQVDFGTIALNNQFFAILRSNIAETPPQPLNHGYEPHVCFVPLRQNDNKLQETGDALRFLAPFGNRLARWEESFDGYRVLERKRGEI